MSKQITRRTAIKSLLTLPVLSSIGAVSSFAATTKKYLLTIQASGAWDVTLFCDPKTNQPGEPDITNWSTNDEIKRAGNIQYAPFSNNESFFNKHKNKMLVVNGIDSQTNAHGIGITFNWSGRLASGYPSLPALFTATSNNTLPMGYVSFGGGYSNTADITTSTIAWGGSSIQQILQANKSGWGGSVRMDPEFFDMIMSSHKSLSIKKSNQLNLASGNYQKISKYFSALNGISELESLGESLPTSSELNALPQNEQNVVVALSGFKAGTTITADITIGGFDTHKDNDSQQDTLLAELTGMIDYVWDKADEMGIASDLTVIIGSDFSRTPYYNAAEGKDHWNVGSYIIMENNPSWGNQVVGATDEVQNALKINPSTLTVNTSGEILTPAHIHKELRRYLGIAGTTLDQLFPINVDNEFRFLS